MRNCPHPRIRAAAKVDLLEENALSADGFIPRLS